MSHVASDVSVGVFYTNKGIGDVWKQALSFAGPEGRIATLPDLIEMRLNSDDLENSIWTRSFDANSFEFVGKSKGGNMILIVAHGVGPLSTLEGIEQIYKHGTPNDHTVRRISQKEFLKLEAGEYGNVEVLDFKAIAFLYESGFERKLSAFSAKLDPLCKARLGPNISAYIDRHEQIMHRMHVGRVILPLPYIVTMRGPHTYGYANHLFQPGTAFAHMLSMNQPTVVESTQGRTGSSDFYCQDVRDVFRLVGVRKGSDFKNVTEDPIDS